MVAPVDERAGHRGKVVDRRHQTREHTFAHCLRANVRVAVRERIALLRSS
jgi:hypothetical protein